MKSDVKYTKDGRKVCVIGQINSTEYIVQEIFVTEAGDELPAGEKFTTKSLLDAPAESWKERNAKKKEQLVKCLDREIEKKRRDIKRLEDEHKLHAQLRNSILAMGQSLEGADLSRLAMIASGACEYLVVNGYGTPKIVSFIDAIADRDTFSRTRGLKLITLFGRADGNLEFGLNRYGDGSGDNTIIEPFETKAQAVERFNEIIEARLDSERGFHPSVHDILKDDGFFGLLRSDLKKRVVDGAIKREESAAASDLEKAAENKANRKATIKQLKVIAKAKGEAA